MKKNYRQLRETSQRLITNDNGSSSHVETWGVDIYTASDEQLMEPIWACGSPCTVNSYNEDDEITHYEVMNAVQMADHLRLYHAEKGQTLYMPWCQVFFEKVDAILGKQNNARKAKEEQEAADLAKTKKEFGYA